MADIIKSLTSFRDARDWSQFHDPRNLALAISLEAAELNEVFLWKKDDMLDAEGEARVREELADIFAYAFLLADRMGFDVEEIVLEKIRKNELKYPVEKAKGTAAKYDKL